MIRHDHPRRRRWSTRGPITRGGTGARRIEYAINALDPSGRVPWTHLRARTMAGARRKAAALVARGVPAAGVWIIRQGVERGRITTTIWSPA